MPPAFVSRAVLAASDRGPDTRRRPPRPRTRVRATDARTPEGTAPRATTRPPPAPRDRDRHVPRGCLAGGTQPRAGEREPGDRREGRHQRPVAAPRPGAERVRTRTEPAPRQRAREDGQPERGERERPDPAVRARSRRVRRLDGVGAEDAREALGPEVLSADRRRAGEAHRASARRRTARPPGSPGGGRIGRAPSTSVPPVARPKGTVTPIAVDGSVSPP